MIVPEHAGFDDVDDVGQAPAPGCIALVLPPSKLPASADPASFQADLADRQRQLEAVMQPLLATGWTVKEMGGKRYICPPA